MLGWTPRLSASEVDLVAAPALGAHTNEILAHDLGLDPTTIDALITAGIVQTAFG